MVNRTSADARPRNQNQSLVANLSDAAQPVPPLRLLGSAADKDESAAGAAPIGASAKPKEAAPKPNERLPKAKMAPASSSKRKHKARPQRAASQGGAKLAASHTAASNATKCADMWRASTAAPTPAQRSKSTPGGSAHASLAAPLPEAGSSLADFKWAWKRDGKDAAAATAVAATARSGTADTGRVDAAARIARTQQQQRQPKGCGPHGGWGQDVKPLSQVLQEQWHHAHGSGEETGAGASQRAYNRPGENEEVARRRRRRPLVAPSPRAVAEAAATVLQKGWQASAESRAPPAAPTLAPPTTAEFAAARRATDAPMPPWTISVNRE